jgi:hypothetical protein
LRGAAPQARPELEINFWYRKWRIGRHMPKF